MTGQDFSEENTTVIHSRECPWVGAKLAMVPIERIAEITCSLGPS